MKNLTNTFYIVFTTVLLNFLVLKVQAQQQIPLEISWEKATIVLNSGDTVRGNLVLTSPRDMIRVTTLNSETRFYSPADVYSFDVAGLINKNGFYNKAGVGNKGFDLHYQTFPWNLDRDYSNFISPAFFIVVAPGKYSLLMRLVKETDRTAGVIGSSVAGYAAGYGARAIAESIINEKLYLRSPENKVIALRKPKDDLKRIFAQHFKQINAYAQTNKLRFNNTTELALIIGYANSLTSN